MKRAKQRGNGAGSAGRNSSDPNLAGKQSGFRISLSQPFEDHQAGEPREGGVSPRVNFQALLYDTFRVQRRDCPELAADREADRLWTKMKSEFYTLQEDRFIVKTCLLPPYAVIDSKFRQKFAKMFHSHKKSSKGGKSAPSLRDVAPSVEELQRRLRSMTQDPSLELRLNLLKVELGLSEDLAEKKKDHEDHRLRAKEREAEPEAKAVDVKKMSKRERKEYLRKKRAADREAQAKAENQQADQLYVAINRVLEEDKLSGSSRTSHRPSPSHSASSKTTHFSSSSSSSSKSRHHFDKAHNEVDPRTVIEREVTPTQVKFLASRDALLKHSRKIQKRVLNKDMQETYQDGRAVPCVVLDDKADVYKGLGNSLALFKHLDPDTMECFLRYTNHDSVLKEEKLLRQQYDALKQKEEDHVSLGENLEAERTRHLSMLQRVEGVHRGTMVNALTVQMEEDIRMIRENHIRAVQLETEKIQTRFAEQTEQINTFYDEQRQSVFRANRKLHLLQVGQLEQDLAAAVARREAILKPSRLDKILVLAEDLECPHLIEDCVELISMHLPTHCLLPGLQSPLLFTGGAVRKIFTNAKREDLMLFMSEYNGQRWYDYVASLCTKFHVLRLDDRVPDAINVYTNTGDSSRALVALRNIMVDHISVLEGKRTSDRVSSKEQDRKRGHTGGTRRALRRGSQAYMEAKAAPTAAQMPLVREVREDFVAKLVRVLSTMTIHRYSAIEHEQRTKAFQLKITQADTFSVTELQHLLVEYEDLLDQPRRELISKEIERRIQVNSDLKVQLTDQTLKQQNFRVAHRNHEVNVMLQSAFRYSTLHTEHCFKRVFEDSVLTGQASPGDDTFTALTSADGAANPEPDQLKLPKWYFEARIGANDAGRGLMQLGWDIDHPVPRRAPDFSSSLPFSALLPPNTCAVVDKDSDKTNFGASHTRPSGVLWQSDGMMYYNGGFYQIGIGYGPGDVVGCAFDQVKEGFFFFKNGEAVCCHSDTAVFALSPELVRHVEQQQVHPSFDLKKEVKALDDGVAPYSEGSYVPPRRGSRGGALTVIDEEHQSSGHASEQARAQATRAGRRGSRRGSRGLPRKTVECNTRETQTEGGDGVHGDANLNCDDLVSRYTERLYHENEEGYARTMAVGDTPGADTGVVRVKGFDNNEGLWIQSPTTHAITKPLHALSAPSHGLFPRVLPVSLFSSLGEKVQDAFMLYVLNDPVPSMAHLDTNRIFGSFMSRTAARGQTAGRASSGKKKGFYLHRSTEESAVEVSKGGFGFGSFDAAAEDETELAATGNARGASGNTGMYSMRPCVSMFSYKKDPAAQIVLNFKGPFAFPVKSFRAVVEAIEESVTSS
jgi:hypothetical protein